MPITPDQLYTLMPAVYRLRDAERGEPLRALLAVLAEQAAIVEDDIAQLYDNWFIETCAEWVVPYIGDLLGARGLYSLRGTSARTRAFSQRARVANTIGYRRRKGTASMLEQLARDVTGWDARAVEFFELLATTQYLNHLRPKNLRTPDLRDLPTLELLDTPFDTITHTADVRHIASGRGKYNIPNVGLFLWRLQAYPLTRSPAVELDSLRYFISPLGCNAPLFTHPVTEDQITHLAEPINVPDPITRLRMRNHLGDYYGPELSVLIEVNNNPIAQADLSVCNLSDLDPIDPSKGWAHTPLKPTIKVAIDPVLGRLAFRDPPAATPHVTFYYGFSADIGGGEYDRAAALATTYDTLITFPARPPDPPMTLTNAINAVSNGGAVELQDSGRYDEPGLSITVNANHTVEVRSANERRATIVLTNDFAAPQDLTITGGAGAELILNGLLIIGGTLNVSGRFRQVTLRHCTLVPGLSLKQDGQPMHSAAPSLRVTSAADTTTTVEIDRCIIGPLDLAATVNLNLCDSIVDGMGAAAAVITGDTASIERSTIIGATRVKQLKLGSESIFTQQVTVERRQEDCMRFSYVPDGSVTPARHRCQPDLALKGMAATADQNNIHVRLTPAFTSLRYSQPAYAQLSLQCAEEITTGAEDGSEMGAFSLIKQALRVANLRAGLDEYLRFGLEAGIFFAS
jgi:hypothetical protein